MTPDESITNHFEVRWIDGYGAVSDASSELAVAIEELAAGLASSQERIELAVGDIRRPDGALRRIGLLRLDVAVATEQRVQGFLHAAVLPPGYRVELEDWRALVELRYGPEPEERIRALYQELAVSRRGGGRERLRALEIQPEDVDEVLEPLEPSFRGRASRRPGSMPSIAPLGGSAGPAPHAPTRPPSQPAPRGSHPALLVPRDSSPRLERGAPARDLDAVPGRITEDTGAWRPARSPRRVRMLLGLAGGAVAIAVAVAVWSTARNGRLTFERDLALGELAHARSEGARAEASLARELAASRAELAAARQRIAELARATSDPVLQTCQATLAELRTTLAEARTRIDGTENRAATLEQERRRVEVERDQLRETNRRMAADLAHKEPQLRSVCDALRAVRDAKLPAECQGAR